MGKRRFIKQAYLTISEARELDHRGYVLKFIGFTMKGMLFHLYRGGDKTCSMKRMI